jgi:hypothetical protein
MLVCPKLLIAGAFFSTANTLFNTGVATRAAPSVTPAFKKLRRAPGIDLPLPLSSLGSCFATVSEFSAINKKIEVNQQ